MFEYDVVPLVVTRGAGEAEAMQQWEVLRDALNEHGGRGFRVVAVTDGPEGRAVIMEREVEVAEQPRQSITEAAEDITWHSSRDQ